MISSCRDQPSSVARIAFGRRRASRVRRLAITLGLCFIAIGVGAKPAPGEFDSSPTFEDAVHRMNTGDYAGALIQLKNVLQKEPKHLPARILLGQACLRQGDGAAAEKELEIALRLGADKDQIYVPLGNALLMQRKYAEILTTIRSTDPNSTGGYEVLTLRGRAHFELGQLKEAQENFAAAIAEAPERPEPLLGQALVSHAQGRFDEALAVVANALDVAPDNAEAWYQRGELMRITGDKEAALAAYGRAIENNPKHMRARLARASLYMELGKPKEAQADAAFVNEAVPEDPKAAFILWQASLRVGDLDRAKDAFAVAVERLSSLNDQTIMTEPVLLRIASLISVTKRDYERAHNYLSQFVQLNPQDSAMRKLLGQVQLRIGNTEDAISTLYPLLKILPNDRELLSMLGDAYLRIGHYNEAADVLERAAALSDEQGALQTQLAVSQIGAGDTEAAIADLTEAFGNDAATPSSGVLLALLKLRRGDPPEALRIISDVNERNSGNPLILNVLGAVQMSIRDLEAAGKSFAAAAQIDPNFFPAQYNLAQLALRQGDPAAAKQLLLTIIARDSRFIAAMVLLADIAAAEGNEADAVKWLERVISIDPDATEPQVKLVELYLALERTNDALIAVKRLLDRNPKDAAAMEVLARVQLVSGKPEDAAATLQRASRYAGFSGRDLMRIARSQVDLQDYKGARKTLMKAATTDLEAESNAALVRLDLLTGDLDAAMERALLLREAAETASSGRLLVAQIMLRQGRIAEAIAAYEAAMQAAPSTDAVLGIYQAKSAAGPREDAFALLTRWLAGHPQDLAVKRALAFGYIVANELDKARGLHESLLEMQPNDPVLLSNLARICQLQHDSRARKYAERAVQLQPDWPVALDTLGWILVTEGDPAGGLKLLRQAISREGNPLTRYHLAVALKELDRTDEARSELKKILQLKAEIEWADQVTALYDSLAPVQE